MALDALVPTFPPTPGWEDIAEDWEDWANRTVLAFAERRENADEWSPWQLLREERGEDE